MPSTHDVAIEHTQEEVTHNTQHQNTQIGRYFLSDGMTRNRSSDIIAGRRQIVV